MTAFYITILNLSGYEYLEILTGQSERLNMWTVILHAWLRLAYLWGGRLVHNQVSSPADCMRDSTLADLIDCLDRFTVGPEFYNKTTYDEAQPTPQERQHWVSAVTAMLDVNENECANISLSSLEDIYSTALFSDESNNSQYCVLLEKSAVDGSFANGWGTMVVPASKSAVSRSIHISVPHPAYDLGTPQQAGALLSRTGANSLFISGRSRIAFVEATDCIQSTKKTYYKTDPAHDVNEPFNIANYAIREWQNTHGGCPSTKCAYIQLHGKGALSCPSDTMFISSGLGHSNSSLSWYNQVDLPVSRIQSSVRKAFPAWNVSLPLNSDCTLTATTNVFGRLVNGIPEGNVCIESATASTATGEFVHIEQAIVARQRAAYDQWATALRHAFETSCSVGTAEDNVTGLCTPAL